MRAYERLLKYTAVNTTSHEEIETTPTGEGEFELARLLAEEMEALGLADVFVDAHAYAYGFLPASPGCEDCRTIGFIAHLDTVDDCGGTLGADDKAGVAEIMTLCERLQSEKIPHGRIAVCFTPDEEIGHGAALLDLEKFGAELAYTVDGSVPCEFEYETFNAAAARLTAHGLSVHPGDAKGKMINAMKVIMEANAMLPAEEVPEKTQDREGFYHLTGACGNVTEASADYILRDHDAKKFEEKKEKMREIAHVLNEKYGPGTVTCSIKDQYRNMAEVIADHPEAVRAAEKAIQAVGLTPFSRPVRGGTDGAQLSFRGLPCPNLGTGGYAYHGFYEHAVAEEMDTCVEILLQLVREFANA